MSVRDGDQSVEIGNPALCPGARHQPIAVDAELPVGAAFDIETKIEIARAARLFEFGRDDLPVAHIHDQPTAPIGHADDLAGIDAFTVGPLDDARSGLARQLRQEPAARIARLRRDTHDHAALDPHLPGDRGLPGGCSIG